MLQVNPISRCLDHKLNICGYEVADLIAIFLLLSVLNFLFGETDTKLLLVWAPPATLALLLRLTKRNRPDNFLKHWLRFQFQPGVWHAFDDHSHAALIRVQAKEAT